MANIELDGANKKIKVDSGDLTLDVPGDIILDADGADLVFADGGTNILKVTNSSSDVVFQPQVDAKDIIFKQYDGTTVATVEDNGTFNVPTSKLAINGTAITSTAAELNILDGVTATATELNLIDGVTATTAELNILDGVTSTAAELNILDGVTSTTAELNILDGVTSTTAELNLLDGGTSVGSSITLADADGFVVNDGGTMKTIPASDVSAYAGGGWTKEFESTLSGDTNGTMDIETTALFDGTYDYHCIKILRLQPEQDDKSLCVRLKFGGSYKTDAYYRYHMKLYDENSDSKGTSRSTNRESIDACSGTGNADSESANGVLYYASPDETSLLKPLYMRFDYVNTAGRIAESSGVGYYANANTALQGIRLIMLSGNGSSSGGGLGDVTVAGYGLKK
jgi:hypothetical protein